MKYIHILFLIVFLAPNVAISEDKAESITSKGKSNLLGKDVKKSMKKPNQWSINNSVMDGYVKGIDSAPPMDTADRAWNNLRMSIDKYDQAHQAYVNSFNQKCNHTPDARTLAELAPEIGACMTPSQCTNNYIKWCSRTKLSNEYRAFNNAHSEIVQRQSTMNTELQKLIPNKPRF